MEGLKSLNRFGVLVHVWRLFGFTFPVSQSISFHSVSENCLPLCNISTLVSVESFAFDLFLCLLLFILVYAGGFGISMIKPNMLEAYTTEFDILNSIKEQFSGLALVGQRCKNVATVAP